MKFRYSLLVKYLGIVGLYFVLVPIALLLVNVAYYPQDEWQAAKYTTDEIEEQWHATAKKMPSLSSKQKIQLLTKLKRQYPEATLFWVDARGKTRFQLPEDASVRKTWNTSATVEFMKKSYDADPFTVVALLGEKGADGFMTIQMPRTYTEVKYDRDTNFSFAWLFFFNIGVVIGLFLFLSWLFFFRLRRRLLKLQAAMRTAEQTGVFTTVAVSGKDEIAELEYSFNRMAVELEESKVREQQEEQLRRELIANLSHDLRTPLTVLRGHAYALKQEQLSEEGKHSLVVIDDKIDYLGQLIDNLLSLSLLTAGKFPYHPQPTDVIALLRKIVASWYPILEEDGFEVDVQLPDESLTWEVDPQWFERIWNNLLQNVVRYAQKGKYVGISLLANERETCLLLEDRGPGIKRGSASKGAGIGLSIVTLMTREMAIDWHIESSETGTRCFLCKRVP